ncbi:heterokaryon incompatibility protein-domain-containing protein [Xylariales sp. AK1849]|nr:heterokaryon incompatibility protein-domain-containing protein [Xylariales sp. AK1849]
MEVIAGKTDSATASRIDQEIVRLKREVVRDDTQGHSCEQCKHLTLKPIPEPMTCYIDEVRDADLIRFDTTATEVRGLAASGCNFWVMIRDKLALIDLDEVVKDECENVTYDRKKYGSWWSDEHYRDLAASHGGDVEKEFLRLRESPIGWGYLPEADWYEIEYPVTQKEFVRVIIRYEALSRIKDRSVSIEVVLVLPERLVRTSIYPGDSEPTTTIFWTTLRALTSPGNFANISQTCVGAPINLDPGSSASMDLYRNWLKKCDITHNCGFSNPPSCMPSLVLDVSDGSRVKLFQVSAAMKECYVALSYCWGMDTQTTILTQNTKSDLLSGINPQHLDPTIRDSVTVARELGFRFLWIDALCIFQDDEEWKTRELGIMDEIYRNATFTIVASAAKDVKEGFLHRRTSTLDQVGLVDRHPQPVFKFRVEGSSEEGEEKAVILRPKTMDDIEPWWERAWTLQEMLFSGRRLQFRGNQTIWLCHCTEPPAQECDGWLAAKDHSYTNYSDSDFKAITTMMRNGNDSAQTSKVLSKWYDLVRVYSSRKLRYRDVRLPGISAIAREFASILGDQYICGLWKSDLPIGLVWFPSRPQHPVSGVKSGPSWSWASYEGTAIWEVSRRPNWRPNQDFEILGDVNVLASPGNPFGEVKTAELRVRGLLLPIPTPARNEYGNINMDVEGQRTAVVFEYPDDLRVQPNSGFNLSLLVLVNQGWSGAEGIVVLDEEESRYSRVGQFDITDVWPMTPENRWVQIRHRPQKSQEELRDRLRSLWGGEQNICQFVLI